MKEGSKGSKTRSEGRERRNKIQAQGVRRVKGTMKSCTPSTVKGTRNAMGTSRHSNVMETSPVWHQQVF